MSPRLLRCVKNSGVQVFLLMLLLSSLLTYCSGATQVPGSTTEHAPSGSVTADNAFVHVTIDRSTPISTSQFVPGITHVDTTLGSNNDPQAINRVKALIKHALPFENTSIMAWGVSDPWPNPSQAEPSDWSTLDGNLKLIIQTGGIPVITLSEAPWWMKGVLQADGTTQLLKQSDEWSDIAYSARILDNKMGAWLHLVQRVAERYMLPPYNVRYFQVWNELKGYYDPVTNAYDYTTSAGDPSGPNARHGYTYMYNQVYQRLMAVAAELRIPAKTIQVGGPYVAMDTWSSTNQSNPSTITRAYGTFDQRSLDVVQYWLQHKAGAGFITMDGANENNDNVNITDPFTAAEKFADVTRWIRSLNSTLYPGAARLPIWWAEWYAAPYSSTTNENYDNAVKAYAMIELLKAGGAVTLSWGGIGAGPYGADLWTTTAPGGGRPLPWYYSYKALKDYFRAGTLIYKTTVSAPGSVEALASATMIMLVNKTADKLPVSVNGKMVSLAPYQVSILNYTR